MQKRIQHPSTLSAYFRVFGVSFFPIFLRIQLESKLNNPQTGGGSPDAAESRIRNRCVRVCKNLKSHGQASQSLEPGGGNVKNHDEHANTANAIYSAIGVRPVNAPVDPKAILDLLRNKAG